MYLSLLDLLPSITAGLTGICGIKIGIPLSTARDLDNSRIDRSGVNCSIHACRLGIVISSFTHNKYGRRGDRGGKIE